MPTAGSPSKPFVRKTRESVFIKFSKGTNKSASVSSSKTNKLQINN